MTIEEFERKKQTVWRRNEEGIVYCAECNHLQDQHWIHGCRAVVHTDNRDRLITTMEVCQCRIHSAGVSYPWVKPNCLHCKHLRRVRYPSKSQAKRVAVQRGPEVTCCLGYWDRIAQLKAIEHTINNVPYYSEMALNCADYIDMRPEKYESTCESDHCSAPAIGLHSGKLVCAPHREKMWRKNQEEKRNRHGRIKE